jgi:hypothetical protein
MSAFLSTRSCWLLLSVGAAAAVTLLTLWGLANEP